MVGSKDGDYIVLGLRDAYGNETRRPINVVGDTMTSIFGFGPLVVLSGVFG